MSPHWVHIHVPTPCHHELIDMFNNMLDDQSFTWKKPTQKQKELFRRFKDIRSLFCIIMEAADEIDQKAMPIDEMGGDISDDNHIIWTLMRNHVYSW